MCAVVEAIAGVVSGSFVYKTKCLFCYEFDFVVRYGPSENLSSVSKLRKLSSKFESEEGAGFISTLRNLNKRESEFVLVWVWVSERDPIFAGRHCH